MTGKEAFINERGDLYLNADEHWQEDYYEAFYKHNAASFKNDNSGQIQADAWDQHYADEIAPAEKAYEQAQRIAAKNTAVNILMLALGFVLCWVITTGAK